MVRKKILIITYYWPPFGGAGVFRIMRFARYLHSLGYELAVLTPEKAFTHVIDERLNEQIPEEVCVYRTRIFEPTTFFRSGLKSSNTKLITDVMQSQKGGWKAKWSKWIRLNLFIPDAKIGWLPFAVSKGKEVIKEFRPDVILSTSPPPTTSLIAKRLAKWSGIPWICDFRDPWTHIYYYDQNPRSPWADKRNRRMEKEVIEQADRITMVSHGFFPGIDLGEKATVITNGFDPEELKLPERKRADQSKFTIRYLGTMKVNQFSEAFFTSLRELCDENEEFDKNLKVEFYGSTVQSTQEYINKLNLDQVVHIKDFVPRKEAVELLIGTDVLLLIIGRSTSEKKMYTTKLFEYVSTGNAVLGLGPIDGAAAEVLRHTKAGVMLDREDKESIKGQIATYFDRWRQGQDLVEVDKVAVDDYSFRSLTARLSDIIQSI